MRHSFFYHSFGAYQEKGAYYFEQFLDHLKVPEGITIDEKWFIGKRVQVILGERQSPTDKKFYLNIASYVNVTESVETPVDPFGHNNDLTQDVPFDTDSDNAATPTPKVNKRKKITPGETAIDQRPDYTTLLNE